MRGVLGAVGRVLVTVGLLLLLFVAYQLWGTGIYQARAQDDLAHQFEQALERNPRRHARDLARGPDDHVDHADHRADHAWARSRSLPRAT